MLLTVAELPEYLRAARRLLADADRRSIVDYLAAHPAAGDLIEAEARAAVCASSTTSTVKRCRYIC